MEDKDPIYCWTHKGQKQSWRVPRWIRSETLREECPAGS